MFSPILSIKIPTAPYVEDARTYAFLKYLETIFRSLSGRSGINNRVLLVDDLYTNIDTIKKLVLDTPVWEVLRFPVQSIKVPGLASDPDVDTTTGMYLFGSSSTKMLMGVAQLPHSYMLGTNIKPHIHWNSTTSTTGNVVWEFDYYVCPVGNTPSFSYTTSKKIVAASEVHTVTSFDDIQIPLDSGVSAVIFWKLRRVGGDALDTYSNDVRLFELDFHYKKDSLGSKREYYKI